jgi:GPI inositol-deacylase
MHRGRGALVSMVFLFLLIFLFVPWQVAFLGCWMIHLHTWILASSSPSSSQPPPSPNISIGRHQTIGVALPLLGRGQDEQGEEHERDHSRRRREPPILTPPSPSLTTTASQMDIAENNARLDAYILLLMTWLLPLVAPVLAVWIRTLMTAGWTVPFQGDHNFVNVAPFLILIDFASWTQGAVVPKSRYGFILLTFSFILTCSSETGFAKLYFFLNSFERKWLSLRWSWLILSMIIFLLGSRTPYRVFEGCNVVCGIVVILRIGRRYWGWR